MINLDSAGTITLAAHHCVTVMQMAIAWLLARSRMMLPIPGTANIAHLDENAGAGSIVLTSGELALLENARGGLAGRFRRFLSGK
jgi:aryl-alcohol dehydrogenase-like predicted oxidoreductase